MAIDVAERSTARVEAAQSEPTRSSRVLRNRLLPLPLVVAAGYLSAAVLVLWRLWQSPNSVVLLHNQDQSMMEWFLGFDAHALVHFENPFYTSLQNYPVGFNGMANTLLLGLGIPFAPVTLLFGPTVTFILVLTIGMAGTAFGWYWLFARHLRLNTLSAVIGGAVCGFGPAAISHAHGHVNFVFGAILPWIIIRLLVAERSVRPIRDGALIGFLISWEIFIGEEPLLLFVVGCALFGISLLVFDRARAWRWLRSSVRPLVAAVGTTLALTGVPIWWQFFGPQTYKTLDHTNTNNDLLEFIEFPDRSLANLLWPTDKLSTNPTELSAYYGLLLVVVLGAAIVMWRRPLVRAASVTVALMCVLSLGTELNVNKIETGIPLPWAAFKHIPPLGSVVELRFAGACLPLVGLIVALAIDRTIRSTNTTRRSAGAIALAVGIVPLIPTPLAVQPRQPVPAFISQGIWKDYVDNGSIVFAPLPDNVNGEPLRWHADADFGFPIAGGYFVGPGADGIGSHNPNPRATSILLKNVWMSGVVPPIGDAQRLQFIADLQYWDADVVVLPHTWVDQAMYTTLTDLFSTPGQYVGDVWVWRFDLKGSR